MHCRRPQSCLRKPQTCTAAISTLYLRSVWVRFPTAESANPILFLFMPGTALRVYSILRAQEAQEVKKLPKASQVLPGSRGRLSSAPTQVHTQAALSALLALPLVSSHQSPAHLSPSPEILFSFLVPCSLLRSDFTFSTVLYVQPVQHICWLVYCLDHIGCCGQVGPTSVLPLIRLQCQAQCLRPGKIQMLGD